MKREKVLKLAQLNKTHALRNDFVSDLVAPFLILLIL